MRHNQTPKWLDLFITAFGAKGLVTLSWWMGALHAERIRARQHSYPFLEVIGGASNGRSQLLSVLWKLIGSDGSENINASKSARLPLLRKINGTDNWPIVIEEPIRADQPFDWDALKPCYNGDMAIRAKPGEEQPKFKGALVILGSPLMSEALSSRFVFVQLEQPENSEASAQALGELLDLHSTEGFDFYDTVKAAGERLEGLLQHTTAYFVQPHNNKRAAFNHAQLHALLGVLDDLFVLPADAREDAHIEIAAMTLITD
ncbi:hypothetical protein ACPA2M_13080 [Ectopseudomonas chengduensis]